MRIQKLVRALKKAKKLPYLISSISNIFYLTGFKGSYGYLLVDEENSFFISDSRYEEYAISIMPPSVSFVLQKNGFPDTLRHLLQSRKIKKIYLEEHSVTLSSYYSLKENLKGITLLRGGDEVNSIRVRKDREEIAILKKAAQITDQCMEHLINFIKPGITEWAIATEAELFYRTHGCAKTSFPTIIASGAGSSMPHYATSMNKIIQPGDALLIDMGCTYEGYNSDLTRTIFIGSVDETIKKIYSIVLEAQIAAIDAIRPGVTAGKLDRIARSIIAHHGFADSFGHSLGHGVGIDVHEIPALKSKSNVRLWDGTVVTVEPGIYIPGKGGVRIEDMVLVTEKGYEILTKFTKEIVVI
ncbi:MAG: Xaa-Pro peptidase family protein [Spirochaetes bacterium]|nr:Xaa-Pro peptidase family protein [Spirochaetota bacterium]